MLKKLTWLAMNRPKATLFAILVLTGVFGAQFPDIRIDTDPENMLEADQPDRMLYNRAKSDFGIHDMIVLGITDESGVFNPGTLAKVERIVQGILKIPGVITDDVISLTTTDDVRPKAGLLEVRRIMESVPREASEAHAIQTSIAANPLLADKVASQDGKGLAIYIPIERKDQAHRIGTEIDNLVTPELGDGQSYHLAGLPIAEDSFGIEMFRQMSRLPNRTSRSAR